MIKRRKEAESVECPMAYITVQAEPVVMEQLPSMAAVMEGHEERLLVE